MSPRGKVQVWNLPHLSTISAPQHLFSTMSAPQHHLSTFWHRILVQLCEYDLQKLMLFSVIEMKICFRYAKINIKIILNPERKSMEIGNCWFVCPHFYWSKKPTNQE
jgi:hypothetical protein